MSRTQSDETAERVMGPNERKLFGNVYGLILPDDPVEREESAGEFIAISESYKRDSTGKSVGEDRIAYWRTVSPEKAEEFEQRMAWWQGLTDAEKDKITGLREARERMSHWRDKKL